MQKTGDSPEVQFLDRLDTPVVVQRQAAGFHSAENCGRSAIAVLDRVVDVPAAVHRQGWSSRSCSGRFTQPVGGASDSVHRMSWVMTAMCSFWRIAPFFALLRLSGVERQVSVEEPSTTKSSSSSRAGGWR